MPCAPIRPTAHATDDFVIAMAYGERPEFELALGTVVALAEQTT